ncbi:hypothetical protein CSA56_12975 [candidate division KSB3 bacterium]|uniref:Uncharacterized protein n=1 Tax=candidate division KSB3 bacterium TaxID=2044937 RepID=A0A2G6KC40_9BACT|nr:MAG: hypothetical protein CSA56_12975 [candidate division KSB3 bacterium]
MKQSHSLFAFIKDVAMYSSPRWLSKGLGIILIPIYTRVFSSKDYGILDIIEVLNAFLVLGTNFGLAHSLPRFFSEAETEEERQTLFSTVFWTCIAAYCVLLPLFAFGASPLSRYLVGDDSVTGTILWALLAVFTSNLSMYLLQLYRLQFQALRHSLFSFIHLSINLPLTLYFVVTLRTGTIGIYWARVLAECSITGMMLIQQFRFFTKPKFSYLPELLRYGLPLVPSTLAYFIIQYLDRYFIQFYHGLSQLGIYAIAYKFTNILLFVSSGFTIAWPPFFWAVYKRKQGREQIRLSYKGFAIVMAYLAFGLELFSAEILLLLTPQDYIDAVRVIYILVTAIVIFNTSDYFCLGIDIRKKTYHYLYGGILAATINIFLNWLFIPRFGITGAAWATLSAYFLYSVYVMYISQKFYPVNYGMLRFFIIVSLFSGCSSIFSTQTEFQWSFFFWKMGLFTVGTLFIPFVTGFITFKEMTLLFQYSKKIFLKTGLQQESSEKLTENMY